MASGETPPSEPSNRMEEMHKSDSEEEVPKSDSELIQMIRNGDVDALLTRLTQDTVNTLYEFYDVTGRLCFSPLCFAIFFNQRDAVSLCTQKGACVDRYSYRFNDSVVQQYSPLLLACVYSHSNIIEDLVEAGADVNAQSGWCYDCDDSPYQFHLDIDTDALENFFAENTNTDSKPCLYYMVRLSNVDVVRTLLRCGADPTLRCSANPTHHMDLTALDIALIQDTGSDMDVIQDTGSYMDVLENAGGSHAHGDFSLSLLLLQETQLGLYHLDASRHLMEETAQSCVQQRQIVEILMEGGYDVINDVLSNERFIAPFQHKVLTDRPPGSRWEDGVFHSHLGRQEDQGSAATTENTLTASSSSSSSDSSTEEELSVCSECTEDKMSEFVSYAEEIKAGALDIDTLRHFGLCWMRHMMLSSRTPRRLKSICRNSIRDSIGSIKMVEKIGKLGLPRPLQEYLLFRSLY